MAKILSLAIAPVTLIALNDATAFGCAACFGASSSGALRAYYISTILLSTMPFVLIAGFVILLRRYRLGGGATSPKE